jgi:hypothetical protein
MGQSCGFAVVILCVSFWVFQERAGVKFVSNDNGAHRSSQVGSLWFHELTIGLKNMPPLSGPTGAEIYFYDIRLRASRFVFVLLGLT